MWWFGTNKRGGITPPRLMYVQCWGNQSSEEELILSGRLKLNKQSVIVHSRRI